MAYVINEEKTTQLKTLLLDAIKSFVESVYEFNESLFNLMPFEGSWSAAEVGSHVYKSTAFIHEIANGEVTAVNRDPEQFIVPLKQMMEDMNAKGKSATVLLPESRVISRTDIRTDITQIEQLLLKDVQELDLTKLCTAMEFPVIGYLTRFELISFAAFHITRHTMQLQNIHKALQDKKATIE